MGSAMSVRDVRKRFGRADALAGVDLEVEKSEFITLLGPSGCGKTTLLRIIGGFEAATSGQIVVAGKDITPLPAHKRPVNTVFQRYLLFPHLDVFENVAFGLRIARKSRAEVRAKVEAALELVGLSEYSRRKSSELSGGQAQRVSLARALVNEPQLLLLDEPLSALDLKVRLQMQAELRRIHRETGTTFLYVTHDQQEAMSLSDRVVVMQAGRIEQVATPKELYHRPATSFVARFVGNANLLPVDQVHRDESSVTLPGCARRVPVRLSPGDGPWSLVVRPEALRVAPPADATLRGRIVDVAFLGSVVEYSVAMHGAVLHAHVPAGDGGHEYRLGDDVGLNVDAERCWLVPADKASSSHVSDAAA